MHGHLVFNYKNKHPLINNPEDRIVFYKPESNMYYLQTHYTKGSFKNEELTLDDVCTTSQMTFSCEAHHLFPIMKELIAEEERSILSITEISKAKQYDLENIEHCVNDLLEDYNEHALEDYKIDKGNETADAFKGYLGLMLYKLFMYINRYMHKDQTKVRYYLKDSLTFNSRHSNYLLYHAMKECLVELCPKLLTKYSENDLKWIFPNIIQTLVVKEVVLLKYFSVEGTPLHNRVFNRYNILKKTSSEYGNPAISLISYFHFFEDPINDDTNQDAKKNIITNDWLEYKEVDVYSTKMDIKMHGSKKNKVLVEFRGFQRALLPYIWRIADPDLKTHMIHGTCNVLSNTYRNDITVLSIYNLRKLVELYDAGPHPAGQRKKKITKRTRKLKK